jgi:anhydro-N-acetylmuramic acid kinase
MKSQIEKLYNISRKKTRHIIGLMSGTSLDGLDIALCAIEGAGTKTKVHITAFKTVDYEEDFKVEIRKVFALKTIDFQHLTFLNVVIAQKHAKIVLNCLKDWKISPNEVDAIASHGQTVFHAPRILHQLENYPNATLQIGDGDHIARETGIITLSDFRQKHVAAGGEGAPLAAYGDYFLCAKKGENRILLNLGGIANFTFLPANHKINASFATDTGTGNTLLDCYAREHFGVAFDKDGVLASAGVVQPRLLAVLKDNDFFARPFPKTTGPELFGTKYLADAIAKQPKAPNPFDVMATLTQFTIDTIVEAIQKTLKKTNFNLYYSGGGAHNPLIINGIKTKLPNCDLLPMQSLGINGDAKEAVLFAVLANETLAGKYKKDDKLGGLPLVSMGKISLPC